LQTEKEAEIAKVSVKKKWHAEEEVTVIRTQKVKF
jgi:hypothetical protein